MPTESSSSEEEENENIIIGIDLTQVLDFVHVYPHILYDDVPRALKIFEIAKEEREARANVASDPRGTSGSRPELESKNVTVGRSWKTHMPSSSSLGTCSICYTYC